MALVRSSVLESLTVTQSLTPSNDSALPYLPLVVQVAPEIVPLFPLPEVSASVEPLPASKLYAATSVFELDTVTFRPAARGSQVAAVIRRPAPDDRWPG